MKRYISYIACLALSIIAIGCVKSDIGSDIEQGGELTLQFSNSALTTRATRANDSSNNEDLLKSVQLFFYPKGSETSNAVYTYTVAKFPTTDADGEASTADTANKSTTVTIKISAGDLDKMFPNNATECSVYAIANGPTPATNAATDVASLKEMSIEADFTTATQASFVMDSDICTITKNGKNLSGEVELTRAAAKIELTVSASNIEIDKKIYMPQIANMKVALLRGVKKGQVDDGSDGTPVDHNVAAEYFDIDINAAGPGFTNGVQTTPFYSYSSKWEAGADDEATLKLMIPWGVSADGTTAPSSYLNYIYEVPVNDLGKSIVRNKYYKITLNVGVLGSLDEDPVTLNPSYVVLDWGTGEVDVELSRPKYLVVDEHHYVINNETELEFLFHSSDECIITKATCTQTNLKTNETSTISRNDNATTVTNKSYALSINNETGTVKLVHGLNNDLYDDTNDTNGIFDFTPYEYTITIQHKNNIDFKETITITQYPAIHGYGDINSDYSNGGENNGDTGFVWVNGYQGTYYEQVYKQGWGGGYWEDDKTSPLYEQSNFDDAEGSTDSSLKAVSMYVFTVSSLEGTKYILGDPRTQSPNNLGEDNFKWASGKILGTNEMREGPMYYLPTDADLAAGESSPTYNMIAPKFRVCSVYGAIDTNGARRYYENMKARCASYQEDGYPAGRWRLPTAAEFELINTLSMKGLLPALYATTMDYWCAHGYGRYDKNQNKVVITPDDSDYGNSNYVSVRCVYDDWYWGSERALTTEDEKQTFTWGDAPRPN